LVALALRHLAYVGTEQWPQGVEVPMVDEVRLDPEPLPLASMGPRFERQVWGLHTLPTDGPVVHRVEGALPPQSAVMPDDDATAHQQYLGLSRDWLTARAAEGQLRAQALQEAMADAPQVVSLAAGMMTQSYEDTPDDDEIVSRAVRMYAQIRRELENR
jgi:hypothetical protein